MKLMLCQTADRIIKSPNWIAQKKMDGIMCYAEIVNGEVNLYGRNNNFINPNFAEIVENLKGNSNAILIGEICCDKFEHTQSRVHNQNKFRAKILEKKYPAKFIIFDIVEKDRIDLRNKTYRERLEKLKEIKENEFIKVIESYENPYELIEQVRKEKGEGVVFKNLDGVYEEGKRSWNCLKYKFWNEVIVKFTDYTTNNAGCKISNGFDEVQVGGLKNSREVMKMIDEQGFCKCEIQYLTISNKSNKMRMPSFKKIIN